MRALLLTLSLVTASSPLQAQLRPRSDSLPRELVTALMGGSMGGPAIDIQAGLADSALPADLFKDALLLGFGDFRGTVMTVAYFPYAPQPTIDSIRARLVAAGWMAAPDAPNAERGFTGSYGPNPIAVCHRESVVVPTVRVRNLSRTLAVISRQISSAAVEMTCGPRNTEEVPVRSMRSGAANTPLPSLPPPPGMDAHMQGSSGMADGNRAVEMNTSLMGDVPLVDMVAHYERLFTAASWRKVEQVMSKSIALMTFEITTVTGERWHCAFSVNVPVQGAADLRLSVRRL